MKLQHTINQSLILKVSYLFNGKELDDELRSNREYLIKLEYNNEQTGFYYYGARYYNPDISIWLSVDPLSDKYPSMSPYMYCAGNPVILVDPDGREVVPSEEAWGVINGGLKATLKENNPFYLYKKTGRMEFDKNKKLGELCSTQQEIIDKYKSLIENDDISVNVDLVDNDFKFDSPKGITSLSKEFAEGATVLSGKTDEGKTLINVYISKNPMYNDRGTLKSHPQREDVQGITSLHEIGGHAYYFSQKIYGYENNLKTEAFERRARDIYRGKHLPNYIKKQEVKSHI